MQRYFTLPCLTLQPYIDRLWGWAGACHSPFAPMLPGTGAELMFHFGEPLSISNARTGRRNLGPAFLLCSRNAPHLLGAPDRLDFLAVRFRSGALRHFCPRPVLDLMDDAFPIAEVWGQDGRDIVEQLAAIPTRAARATAIEAWLLKLLARYHAQQPLVDLATRALYYRHRDLRIDDLAAQAGSSRRTLERVFRIATGLTPKGFQRRARFQLTARELLQQRPADPLATALDHGYYDQAHFIHDFQRFTGVSPNRFIREAKHLAHFYNPSIFSPDRVPTPR